MYDQPIKLISSVKTQNEYGDTVSVENERSVWAEVVNVGMSEFYKAQALGLKPEIKFKLADYLDYNGEKKLKYQGYGDEKESEYSVIRTYRKGNELEITCKRGID